MYFIKGTLLIRTRIIILLLVFVVAFLNHFKAFSQQKKYIVVLDAGHGGSDPGNIGNGYREKTISLKVVLELGKILSKESFLDIKYTRTTDVNVNLWKRGDIANSYQADLFVSIHCNSHSSKAEGTESFVLGVGAIDKNFKVAKDFVTKENAVIFSEDDYKDRYKGFDVNSAESVIELSLMQEENLDKSLVLAADIQSKFKNLVKRTDRGVKQAKFVVLYQTYMPSVLVELGFLTNKSEGKYLNSKKGQVQMANAIATAIKKYFNSLKANTIVVKDTSILIKDSVAVEKKDVNNEIIFKIQIASSKKEIKTNSYNFKGLKNIERVKVGEYYKYYYGVSKDYNETKQALTLAHKKGYKTAFIAAFKNGEKISLSEALK